MPNRNLPAVERTQELDTAINRIREAGLAPNEKSAIGFALLHTSAELVGGPYGRLFGWQASFPELLQSQSDYLRYPAADVRRAAEPLRGTTSVEEVRSALQLVRSLPVNKS